MAGIARYTSNPGGTGFQPVLIYDYINHLRGQPMKPIKVIVEKHPDGYIAYPLGLKGVVIGQGDTYEEAMADVKSAIIFHIETFGPGAVEIATSEM
jgi:predicted RNase H-like HicB family nuclease